MADVIAELERLIESLDDGAKADLDGLLQDQLRARWLPDPRNEPQTQAYYSKADLLLFGGAAGGGKTDLIIGCALTQHKKSVIFRRQSTDLRGIEDRLLELAGNIGWNGSLKVLRQTERVIELGHLEKPGSEKSWQGRPHDFIGFDEGAQLSKAKVAFVLGWLRTIDYTQRCRAIIGSNPPTGTDGEWLFEWFAPWLDQTYPNPAEFGELRWAVTAKTRDAETIWLPDSRPVYFIDEKKYRLATEVEIAKADEDDNVVFPKSRTFIQSFLKNNPYYAKDGRYRAQLQTMPEPLRSQLLKGDFVAGREDHEWQVIPTAWVKAAIERWTPEPPNGAAMTAIGVDVAQGGADDTVLAPRHGPWFAPLIRAPGAETPTGSEVAGLIVRHRRNNAVIVIDVGGGYGGGAKLRLEDNEIKPRPFNGAVESHERSKDRQLAFVNKRAEAYWRFREALDPDQEGGSPIALPPEPRILADLTSVRWKLAARGIQCESKDELKKPERLGRSPDDGDAIVMSWAEGERAIVAAERRKARAVVTVHKTADVGDPATRGTGWMAS